MKTLNSQKLIQSQILDKNFSFCSTPWPWNVPASDPRGDTFSFWFMEVFVVLGPTIAIMTLSLLIFKELRHLRNQRPKDLPLAEIGLNIAVVYIICQSLTLPYVFILPSHANVGGYLVVYIVGSISNLTFAFNCSVNFYIWHNAMAKSTSNKQTGNVQLTLISRREV